ncbi:hypothetical protein PSHT_08186 [Puccinia striiformis]|uniref:Uncharacterized protein n=1 Tax=Puccinia striiformis TaxID=27350 RepID=A0A2S4VRL0_9BASI|nr:hypothetical protein PSHT_08186 [Puccinia striiformis]
MELSSNIKCCSETKDGSNKVLKRDPFLGDNIHKSSNTKGQQFVKRYTLEHRRKSSNASSSAGPLINVPLNLPINSYAPEYLATLSELHIKILNPKPAINFPKLLLLTKVSFQ